MGPLHGVRVIELAGIGPGPLAAMMLADMGATVLRIERADAPDLGQHHAQKFNITQRGRQRNENHGCDAGAGNGRADGARHGQI